MTRRIRSIITALTLSVVMVLTMMPAAAFADEVAAYDLWVGGVQVTSENLQGEGWSYNGDGTSGTLTLTNANITGNYEGTGIYSYTIDHLTIALEGTSTVGSDSIDAGIYTGNGNLTITGSGKLSAIGNSYGIVVSKNLTVDGAEVSVQSTVFEAINCNGMNLNNATVTARSKEHGGIDAEEDVAITNSKLDTEGGSIENGKIGVRDALWCANLTVTDSEIDAHAKNADDRSSRPSGILVLHNANITNSTIKTSSACGSGIDCGQSEGDKLVIKDSTVEAHSTQGGGLYCEGDMTLENSTINASGKDTTWAYGVINAEDGNIDITDCVMSIESDTDMFGMYSSGSINFKTGNGNLDTYITVDSTKANESEYAVVTRGDITLGENLEIVEPKNGTIGQTGNFKSILDGETPSRYVIIKEVPKKEEPVEPVTPVVPPAAEVKVADDLLLAQMKAQGKNTLAISWNNIEGAEGYDIFFAMCNKGADRNPLVYETTVSAGTLAWFKAGLDAKTSYKAFVQAWVMKNGQKTYVKTSPTIHAYTSGGTAKYTNAKSVTVNKKKVTLKKGKTFKIKAKVNRLKKSKKLMPTGHAAKLRYISSDPSIASVSSKGKIKAKSAGTCKIYVLAVNGAKKTITVKVK